ncbi:MAG: polyprenyl synthetase family protein [Bacillota bacterium]|jgi:heptaprenyl diphosphate synthase|nr:polyprenyl synthetase family protein [Bacillota bacterium]
MNMTLETISEAIYRESAVLFVLDEVERRLHRVAAAREGTCGRLAAHLIQAGGKRLRPLLVILSGECHSACSKRGGGGGESSGSGARARESLINVAVTAELIHTASLIHDDILDRAATRRGRPTLNSLWGSHAAVLTGDFLFATAFGLLAREHEGALALMAGAVRAMCEGEIQQAASLFDPALTEKDYISRIEKKTASLLGACCGAGALVAGAPAETVASLISFGRNLGLGFQIIDDLLDFTRDEESLGKPAGSDLAQGILTLPVIYLLQDGSRGQQVRKILARRTCGPAELAAIIQAVRETPALDYAYQRAVHFTQKAKACLACIPEQPARSTLLAVADGVLARVN